MTKLVSANLTGDKLCTLTYTTTDGEMLSLKEDAFDAKIISHSYTDKGVVLFDKPITIIGDYAFRDCTSLTSITIPDCVVKIGEHAFAKRSSLKAFYGKCSTLDNRCIIIGGELMAFAPAGLNQYAIPDSVTLIGSAAFAGCKSLTSITIPDSVTSIGRGAFFYCTSLTSVTIPNSVTSIGESAFSACTSLTSVTIPDSVTLIGRGAFYNCTSLASVTIGNSVTWIEYAAFCGCKSLTSVTIPDIVTSIGEKVFYGCTSLTSVTIPDSITSIGEDAFEDCTSLTAFYGKFASEDNRCLIVDGVLNTFAIGCGLTTYAIPNSVTSIGERAFSWCTSLTSVTIPNSVTSIGDWAFAYCSSLISVTIPDSVTSIGNWAFDDCSSLTSITIPDNVTSIGLWAFAYCFSLTSVYCKPTTPPTAETIYSTTTLREEKFMYLVIR